MRALRRATLTALRRLVYPYREADNLVLGYERALAGDLGDLREDILGAAGEALEDRDRVEAEIAPLEDRLLLLYRFRS